MNDRRKNIIKITVVTVTILVILGAIPVLQTGTRVYKDQIQICSEFEKNEKIFAEKNFDFIQRGFINRYIFSFMASPAPTLVLFYNSVPFNSLQASVDSASVILKNYSYISSYNCKRSSYFNIDFATYLFICSIVLIPMFVFYCHPDKRFLKANLNYHAKLLKYLNYVLARYIYIVAVMTILLGLVFGIYAINGIKLTRSEVLHIIAYFLFSLVIQLFILVSATLARVAKRRVLCSIVIILIWAGSIFLFGCVVSSISVDSNDYFLSEKLASLKNNTSINFENFASKILSETKKSDREKIDRELLRKYLENLRYFRDSENLLIENLKKEIKSNSLSRLNNPFIYLMGSHGDIGSLGFQVYIDFYQEVNNRQYKIAEQYLKKVLEKKTGEKMPIFNPIIKLKSKLPHYFFPALILYTVLIIFFFFLVYFPFKRSLFPLVKKSFKNFKLAVKKGEYVLLHVEQCIEDFSSKLFNVIFKKGEKFDGNITIDGKPLAEVKSFYLPDLSGEDMSQLALLSGGKNPGKLFKELNFDELCKLFPQIRGCDVLLLDCAGIKLEARHEIAIIDIYPEITRKKYSRFCHISLEEEGYLISQEKERGELPADKED